jgi:hypothetical protein
MTHGLCIEAVRQDGMALRLVPPEPVIHELCLTAVQQTGNALRLMPEG